MLDDLTLQRIQFGGGKWNQLIPAGVVLGNQAGDLLRGLVRVDLSGGLFVQFLQTGKFLTAHCQKLFHGIGEPLLRAEHLEIGFPTQGVVVFSLRKDFFFQPQSHFLDGADGLRQSGLEACLELGGEVLHLRREIVLQEGRQIPEGPNRRFRNGAWRVH